jgi:protein ImuB
MLWLALRFPSLALEIHARTCEPSQALALAETTGTCTRLLLCNAAAHACGIRPGMSPASAFALCSRLKVINRITALEHDALEHIAIWACQFTSKVSIAAPSGLLLEIGGSASLFGGIRRLRQQIGSSLRQLGYESHMACAPTPQAALWFSRAGIAACVEQAERLEQCLGRMPVSVLENPESAAALERFGLHTIGACLRLPRAGLARRLDPKTVNEIDRALGRIPDPRLPFTLPENFNSRLELPAPATRAEALLFAGQRLCAELQGYLAARAQGAQQLCWTLHHERRGQTLLTLELAAASRDAEHLLLLLRERLARTTLSQPVTAIELACTGKQALAPSVPALLPAQPDQSVPASCLMDVLRARLGAAAVSGLEQCADHRPERAWRSCAPGTGMQAAAVAAPGHRPIWLLPRPLILHESDAAPRHEGPLTLLAGPERIEYGWWDDQPAVRDYFIARDAQQALLWIYRERGANGRWFLHGFFS